jgi:hypothetical protein
VKITYQSPGYRADLVKHRYVRRAPGTDRYRVYECSAKARAKNRDADLARMGAGPTIREAECNAASLPAWLVERIGTSRAMWKWD